MDEWREWLQENGYQVVLLDDGCEEDARGNWASWKTIFLDRNIFLEVGSIHLYALYWVKYLKNAQEWDFEGSLGRAWGFNHGKHRHWKTRSLGELGVWCNEYLKRRMKIQNWCWVDLLNKWKWERHVTKCQWNRSVGEKGETYFKDVSMAAFKGHYIGEYKVV